METPLIDQHNEEIRDTSIRENGGKHRIDEYIELIDSSPDETWNHQRTDSL